LDSLKTQPYSLIFCCNKVNKVLLWGAGRLLRFGKRKIRFFWSGSTTPASSIIYLLKISFL
jgi:hypothetical protein